jgi:hypothetical protein
VTTDGQEVTDDQIRAEYVEAMGPDLGNLHHDLQNDVARLLRKWNEFGELYRDDQIELLNTVASNFFYFLQQWFYEDAMLHIARLTDPPETGGRAKQANLTIMRFPMVITNSDLRTRIDSCMDEARTKCQFARDWRNKGIAHTDLEVHRKGRAVALPAVTRQHIEGAAEALATPVRLVNQHFGKQSLLTTLSDPWGVRSLVHHLKQAVEAQQRGRVPG